MQVYIKKDNMSHSKVDKPTVQNLNSSEVDEIANNEPKRTMIRIINEIKENLYETWINSVRTQINSWMNPKRIQINNQNKEDNAGYEKGIK